MPGLNEPVSDRCWTVSEKGIFFVPATPQPWGVHSYRFSTHEISPVVNISALPACDESGLAVSPDEKSLLFTQVDTSRSEITLLQQNFEGS